jgi:hypothetical protein
MRYQIIFEWSRFVMTSKSCRILSREFGAWGEIIDTNKGKELKLLYSRLVILELQIQKWICNQNVKRITVI